MATRKNDDKVQSRDRGQYVSVEQDDKSGLWHGVVTTSLGDDVPESVLWRDSSGYSTVEGARSAAEAWCRDRGYQFTSV